MFVCYIQGCRGDRGGDVVRNQGKRLNRQGSFWVVVVLGFDFVFERKKFFLAIRFLQFLISLSLSLSLSKVIFPALEGGVSRFLLSRFLNLSFSLTAGSDKNRKYKCPGEKRENASIEAKKVGEFPLFRRRCCC